MCPKCKKKRITGFFLLAAAGITYALLPRRVANGGRVAADPESRPPPISEVQATPPPTAILTPTERMPPEQPKIKSTPPPRVAREHCTGTVINGIGGEQCVPAFGSDVLETILTPFRGDAPRSSMGGRTRYRPSPAPSTGGRVRYKPPRPLASQGGPTRHAEPPGFFDRVYDFFFR